MATSSGNATFPSARDLVGPFAQLGRDEGDAYRLVHALFGSGGYQIAGPPNAISVNRDLFLARERSKLFEVSFAAGRVQQDRAEPRRRACMQCQSAKARLLHHLRLGIDSDETKVRHEFAGAP